MRIGPAVVVIVRQCGVVRPSGQEAVLLEVLFPADMSIEGPQGLVDLRVCQQENASPLACARLWVQAQQTVRVGPDIALTPARIAASRIRLGIVAPGTLKVSRDDNPNIPGPAAV